MCWLFYNDSSVTSSWGTKIWAHNKDMGMAFEQAEVRKDMDTTQKCVHGVASFLGS
jgi:hypothetical protein